MKVLVIGASVNPSRISHQAVRLLDQYDHQAYAIGRQEGKIGNTDIITGTPIIEGIDTVTLYINPTIQPLYYDYITTVIRPRRVIFNPGTENGELYRELQAHSIRYEEACTLVMLRSGQF